MDNIDGLNKKFVSEMKFNRFFMQGIWPIYRNLTKHKLSERCETCTISSRYAPLQNGQCDACLQRTEPPPAARSDQEKELHQTLLAAQGKGKGLYDALIFFSGGKDSIYMVKTLQERYKDLRILAFTVDNGFNSPLGEQNISKVCKQHEIEHLQIRPYEVFNTLYRFGFENFSHRGFFATDAFGGELFQDIGRNVAAQMKIPLMLLGYTPQQIALIDPGYHGYNLYDPNQAIMSGCQNFTREQYLGADLREAFSASEMKYWWDASRYDAKDIPQMIFPFNAWGYDKNAIIQEAGKFAVSSETDPMLTNHLYCIPGIYLDYQILGYCSFEPEWATYVRENTADKKYNRSTWEVNEYFNANHPEMIKKNTGLNIVLNKLGMNHADLDSIVKRSIEKRGQAL